MAKPANIDAIENATGRTWDDWLRVMDEVGANDMSHKELATKVQAELEGVTDNPGWWAQTVTVAYEQHIGRRAPGQAQDGTFQASVSRATPLGMEELMERWTAFATGDDEVLASFSGEPRTSGTDKRMHWRVKGDDGTGVQVTSEPKRTGAASLIVTLTGSRSFELSQEARARWAGIVERFVSGL